MCLWPYLDCILQLMSLYLNLADFLYYSLPPSDL